MLLPRMNGKNYLEFLREQLPGLIGELNLPPAIYDRIHFMHDGVAPHHSLAVKDHLNEVYPNRWIGRNGPIACLARSPDFNSCDYFP